jgi:dolichol-phosphate mannosyltransferase
MSISGALTPLAQKEAGALPTPKGAPRLSIVIPTFNEAGNIAELVRRVAIALPHTHWELIIVDDDSPDGTAATAKALAAGDARVRCLRRVARRGLAGACIEGILSSSAPFVAVMDGDLQHDETLLAKMLAQLEQGTVDLVAGTRYVAGGDASAFGKTRGALSRIANNAAQRLLGTKLSDPMSGFFMLRREIVETHAAKLMPEGFKILVDIATTAGPSLRVAEEAYSFRERFAGESKFDVRIGLEFLGLILSKLSFGVITPRFLIFAMVGTTGLAVHLLALKAGLLMTKMVFPAAQALATFAAMGNNFLLNNLLTYRDRRLHGFAMLKGFSGYCVIGAAGALANVGVAAWFYSEQPVWWAAGIAGAIMGALWNYSMSSRLVWRAR